MEITNLMCLEITCLLMTLMSSKALPNRVPQFGHTFRLNGGLEEIFVIVSAFAQSNANDTEEAEGIGHHFVLSAITGCDIYNIIE